MTSLAPTRPAPGELGLLQAGLHSRRLILLRSLLAQAERHGVPPAVLQHLDRHWRLLEHAEASNPSAVRSALAYPSVGNWLLRTLSIPFGEREAFEDSLSTLGGLAAAVALRAGTSFRATLPAPAGRLTLPGIGVYDARSTRVRVVAGPRSLRLTPGGRRTAAVLRPPYTVATGPGWHGLRVLSGSTAVLDDLDSYRVGVTPADSHTGTGPGGGRVRLWQARWRAALVLLGSVDPARLSEIRALVRSLVPLANTPGGTHSGSLRSAPWSVLTELPCSATEMATVLVHEVQHSKLSILCDLTPLHYADDAAVHQVPWRSDARPLDAVLQGTYAHLALADFWHRLASREGAAPAARRRGRAHCEGYRDQVAEALAVLRSSGELSRNGREFTKGMTAHLATLSTAQQRARRTPESERASRTRDVQ